MTTTVEDDTSESVDDLLRVIKNPGLVGQAPGSDRLCLFMQRVQPLSENILQAIAIACQDTDVTNDDIVLFINTTTNVKVNLSMVQKHRNRKRGCLVCDRGA